MQIPVPKEIKNISTTLQAQASFRRYEKLQTISSLETDDARNVSSLNSNCIEHTHVHVMVKIDSLRLQSVRQTFSRDASMDDANLNFL